jgi:NAD(P)H-hydrate repair Nnr-like enzyme with NAD(P)H-hydrate dehydratase domain
MLGQFDSPAAIVACSFACDLVKEAAYEGYEKKGRSLIATDLIDILATLSNNCVTKAIAEANEK